MNIEEMFNRIAITIPLRKKKRIKSAHKDIPVVALDNSIFISDSITFGFIILDRDTKAKALITMNGDSFEFQPVDTFSFVASSNIGKFAYIISANDAIGFKCKSANVLDLIKINNDIFKSLSFIDEQIYKFKMKFNEKCK